MSLKLFYDNITLLDYAYWDDNKGPVGNSLKVHAELEGIPDQDGIISDFSHTKRNIKKIIDQIIDHRFLIPKNKVRKLNGHALIEEKVNSNDNFYYHCPEMGICEIDVTSINLTVIKKFIESALLANMPDTIKSINVILEDALDSADTYFHYTHGLKNHYGNCQRLLHGHKNPIRVWIGGVRNKEMEKFLAEDVFKGCVHFAIIDNIVNQSEISFLNLTSGSLEKIPVVHIKYKSNQGVFEMKLPGKMVHLTDEETSVENLSKYFHKIIKSKTDRNTQVKIQAFEGIGKGAIYSD